MTTHYLLEADGKTPKPVTFEQYLAHEVKIQSRDWRRVAVDTVGDVQVSTVFLVHDHRFSGDGPPVLWETMIFGGAEDGWQDRYTSYDDAVAGHAKALELVKGAVA